MPHIEYFVGTGEGKGEERSVTITEANKPVSTRLLTIISKKGLKQVYVAEKVGCTPQELCDMLNGRRLIKACDILKLADALDVKLDDLFKEEKEVKE